MSDARFVPTFAGDPLLAAMRAEHVRELLVARDVLAKVPPPPASFDIDDAVFGQIASAFGPAPEPEPEPERLPLPVDNARLGRF